MFLFRKYLSNFLVYYDLPSEQNNLFKSIVNENEKIDDFLSNSIDPLVKSYSNEIRFNPLLWVKSNSDFIFECDHSALMINNGAKYTSKKQYKAQDNLVIYEVYGSFEIFSYKRTFGPPCPCL